MPGIAGDGSEDLPNRKEPRDIGHYASVSDCILESKTGEFVRYADREKAIQTTNLCPEVVAPPNDYLKQKLDIAYGELKIITDNIQLLKPHHVSKLIELNSMIGNILHWQLLNQEEQEAK